MKYNFKLICEEFYNFLFKNPDIIIHKIHSVKKFNFKK